MHETLYIKIKKGKYEPWGTVVDDNAMPYGIWIFTKNRQQNVQYYVPDKPLDLSVASDKIKLGNEIEDIISEFEKEHKDGFSVSGISHYIANKLINKGVLK